MGMQLRGGSVIVILFMEINLCRCEASMEKAREFRGSFPKKAEDVRVEKESELCAFRLFYLFFFDCFVLTQI